MPQIFKIGSYWVYFWSDENEPLEPVHVHVSEGRPVPNGTKFWITRSGKCILVHNKSKISRPVLNQIIRVIEARSEDIIKCWIEHFEQITFYC